MNETLTNKMPKSGAVIFDHEKLDVYRLELGFIAWVTELLEHVSAAPVGKIAEVCDQLDRASLSSLLNTAEGNGKRQRQVRAKFFDDARGSATECAACLDALVAKKVVKEERIYEGKTILIRIVSMLCGLVDRFDSASDRIAEEAVEYHINGMKQDSRTRTTKKTRTRRNE
jgi:four helix bundle protein